MNATILRLSLSSQTLSPIFSYSSYSSSNALKFSNIHASRLFSNFYFANNPINTNFYNSKFVKCLNAAIRVNEVSIMNSTKYNRLKGTDLNRSFSIIGCLFYQVQTLGESGGAVNLKYTQGTIIVKETGFYMCKTDADGGAMYLDTCWFYANSVCFHNCTAAKSNTAMLCSCSRGVAELNNSVASVCSYSVLYSNNNIISLNLGKCSATLANFTKNTLAESYPCVRISGSSGSFAKFHNIEGSKCSILYTSLTASADPFIASHFNFVDNQIRNEMIVAIGSIVIRNSVLKGNQYYLGDIRISLGSQTSCIFVESTFDAKLNYTAPEGIGPRFNFTTLSCKVEENIKNIRTIDLEYINTRQCWVNDVKPDQDILVYVLQWKRSLIVLGVFILIVFIGIYGKRIFELALNKRATQKQPQDTDSMIPHDTQPLDLQYDFDM